MKYKTRISNNPKLEEIYMLIFNIASGNYDVRGNTSSRGDELDAVITALNMLVEELKAKNELK